MEEAIIGIAGTILGTILGWVLNTVSNKGKLSIYLSDWSDSFEYNSDYGEMIPSSNVESTILYSYNFCIDVYNSSAEPLIMREIKVAFSDGKKDIQIDLPKDERTRRNNGVISFYDNLESVTIPAKSVLHFKLRNGMYKEKNCDLYIWKAKKVFLLYKDKKNKQHRILLKEEDYSRYFENHPQEEKHNG